MSILPPALIPGDKVTILSPSRQIKETHLSTAISTLQSWGLEVVLAEHVFDKEGYFAGKDKDRLKDLQSAIDDNDCAAIFCARGGYGLSRIIDKLDLASLKTRPKWIVGFSDITALHLKLNKQDMVSIHGLMPVQFEYAGTEKSIESLKNLLFKQKGSIAAEYHSANKNGIAKGELVGGNLSLLVDSLGTATEIGTENKILFVEEIDEYLYKIDRMFNHLKRAGKLKNLAGLIVGGFSQMKDTHIPFGKILETVILEKLEGPYFPVAFNFPIGHESLNMAVPVSHQVLLEVNHDQSLLTF